MCFSFDFKSSNVCLFSDTCFSFAEVLAMPPILGKVCTLHLHCTWRVCLFLVRVCSLVPDIYLLPLNNMLWYIKVNWCCGWLRSVFMWYLNRQKHVLNLFPLPITDAISVMVSCFKSLPFISTCFCSLSNYGLHLSSYVYHCQVTIVTSIWNILNY